MTIGYIFTYLGDGGAEENAILLAKQAIKSGYRVVFIVSNASQAAAKRLKDEKIDMINLPMESSFNIVSVRRSAMGLKKIIQSEKIDIIHSHMLREQSIGVLAKLLGAKFKLVRTFHRFDQFNIKMKPFMFAYRRYTDAFISISDQMSDYLKVNGISENVHLIKNGVAKVNTTKIGKAMGFIGRLTEEKGIFEFIKTNYKIFKSKNLVIAGDGPQYDQINKYIIDNKLKVNLMGKITNKPDFYNQISVLVLPSRTEVLPLVVLEAYSCGLPVVAFRLDSFKGLIEKENGVLVKYPDYSRMGIVALDLMRKTDTYRQTNIAKYNAEYSVEKMWSQTKSLYQQLAGVIKR